MSIPILTQLGPSLILKTKLPPFTDMRDFSCVSKTQESLPLILYVNIKFLAKDPLSSKKVSTAFLASSSEHVPENEEANAFVAPPVIVR